MVYLIALAIALARFGGVTHIAYQAVAHCYVGGLLGHYIGTKNKRSLFLFIALCVVEIYCAMPLILQKLGH